MQAGTADTLSDRSRLPKAVHRVQKGEPTDARRLGLVGAGTRTDSPWARGLAGVMGSLHLPAAMAAPPQTVAKVTGLCLQDERVLGQVHPAPVKPLRRAPRADGSDAGLSLPGARVFVLLLVLVSILWIPVIQASQSGQLFIYIQAISSYLQPPVAVVFIMGCFWKRTNEKVAWPPQDRRGGGWRGKPRTSCLGCRWGGGVGGGCCPAFGQKATGVLF